MFQHFDQQKVKCQFVVCPVTQNITVRCHCLKVMVTWAVSAAYCLSQVFRDGVLLMGFPRHFSLGGVGCREAEYSGAGRERQVSISECEPSLVYIVRSCLRIKENIRLLS